MSRCSTCARPVTAAYYERDEGQLCPPCGQALARIEWADRSKAWLDQRGIHGEERSRLLHAWGVPT